MKLPRYIERNWSGGVITSQRSDELGDGMSPRGMNSALLNIGGGKAVVGKRRGAEPVTPSSQVGGSDKAIFSQHGFRWFDSSSKSFTNFHLVTTDEGRLELFDPVSGTFSVVDSTFLTVDTPAIWATASNMAFVVNGTDAFKVVNISSTLTTQAFGITRPTIGTFAAASSGTASAYNPTGPQAGAHEFRVTYYNANSGGESSASDTYTSGALTANKKIDLTNVPVSGDTQVTARKIYVRQPGASEFFLIHTLSDNSTTSVTVDFDRNSLTVIAPTTSSNNVPTTGVTGMAFHASRMFLCDQYNVYWSEIEKPEAFGANSYEPVNPKDGQKIVGIISASESTLVIFKERSVYVLNGIVPSSWSLELLTPAVGCVAPKSIIAADGKVWWWGLDGPMVWDLAASPIYIGYEFMQPDVDQESLASDIREDICVAVDPPNRRIMWAVPSVGSTRLDFIIPFNYRLGVFEANKWEVFDIASMTTTYDESDNLYVFIGNHNGKLFKWWTYDTDGARVSSSGTAFTLWSNPTEVTDTTFTDSTGTFDSVENIKELYVYMVSPSFNQYIRRRITDYNSGTKTFTIASAWGTNPSTSWYYGLGAPMFEFDTRWVDFDDPFTRKRYQMYFMQCLSDAAESTVVVDVFGDYTLGGNALKTFVDTVAGTGASWDVGMWDEDFFAAEQITHLRRNIGLVCWALRIRVKHYEPDRQFVLLRLGYDAYSYSSKR